MRRFAFLLLLAVTSQAQDLRYAALGDFKLDDGEVIRDCRVAYRIYGANHAKTMVVTTWLGGSTTGLASSIGDGQLFDTSKYRVIAIDAFGDGLSSSPSNSAMKPFPRFTIHDMVRSQHELLTRELHIDHVYAISGLSMGGMQTFQWLASYPDFMDNAIPITGTPKQTSYDLLLWNAELNVLESNVAEPMKTIADINSMHLNTPPYIVGHVKPASVAEWMTAREAAVGKLNREDYESQVRAAVTHDIGTIGKPHARVLVIVSEHDQMVNPTPAREFAKTHHARLVTLSGNCGHLASACEAEKVKAAVHAFLDR